MITQSNLREVLSQVGFISEDSKKYLKDFGNGCILKVDFNNESITYPVGVTIHDRTTCNFRANENFVVLECVNRLLDKGYKPQDIELEPRWQLGHNASGGKADILVKDRDNNPTLIIECKTFGDEFDKEWKNMEEDGGQLFSYLQQDSGVKYLCLYCSDFVENEVQNEYKLISVQDNEAYLMANDKLLYKNAKNVKERYNVWKVTYGKDYATRGIFENDVSLYEIGKFKYTLHDLENVNTTQKIQKLYGKYRNILRKYNVSGEENAFDKLVNLFLCKIVDETNNENKDIENQTLKFYWKGSAFDDKYDLQDRLQGLYKQGMKDFLGEEITYIEDKKVQETFRRFKNDPDSIKKQIMDYFHQLKFYTNNAFSFIDVHNKKLFEQNSEILLETIKMFQDLKLKSEQNNQFLGDLFEGFLNQGVKQSEGQFFTPLPIVRFIVSSLPLEEMIKTNQYPLKVIDYACGAGHFLTEYTEQITDIIHSKNIDKNPSDYYKSTYGIEKESRLAKVSKVSAFMFGKGGINILYNDGLHQMDEIQNESFDLIIANPPYSVKGFLETLSDKDKESYELYQYVSDISKSDVIQLFFIERTKQLLKDGGIAAIIVPSTVINKNGIYSESTKLILKYFDIMAITQLAKGAFSKTGTETLVLFLRKKSSIAPLHEHYKNRVDIWFSNNFDKASPTETIYQDLELVKEYCDHIGTDFEAYKKDIINLTNEQKKIEKEKLYYYLLARANPQSVLVMNMPSTTDEIQKFLGYKWSKRKGFEGIQYLNSLNNNDIDSLVDNNIHRLQTPLFDPNNLLDETKVNTILRKHISGVDFNIPDELENTIQLIDLQDMISFRSLVEIQWNLILSMIGKFNVTIPTNYPKRNLGDIIVINPKSNTQVNTCKNDYTKQYPFYTSGENIYTTDEFLVDGENIFISTGGIFGVKYYNGQASYSTDTFSIKSKNSTEVLTKYLYVLLQAYEKEFNDIYFKGTGLKHLQKNAFLQQEIPIPSTIKEQEDVLKLLREIEIEEIKNAKLIRQNEKEIQIVIDKSLQNPLTDFNLSDSTFDLSIGKRVLIADKSSSGIPLYSANVKQNAGFVASPLTSLTNFDRPSVLWGIDGDWMTNYLPENKPFYPTDHCGVLRTTNSNVNLKYVSFVLERKGKEYRFSRTKRASIASISSLTLSLPSITIQNNVANTITKLEQEINKAKNKIDDLLKQKRIKLLEALS